MFCSEWFLNVTVPELLEYNKEVWSVLQLQQLQLGWSQQDQRLQEGLVLFFQITPSCDCSVTSRETWTHFACDSPRIISTGEWGTLPDFLAVRQGRVRVWYLPGLISLPKIQRLSQAQWWAKNALCGLTANISSSSESSVLSFVS